MADGPKRDARRSCLELAVHVGRRCSDERDACSDEPVASILHRRKRSAGDLGCRVPVADGSDDGRHVHRSDSLESDVNDVVPDGLADSLDSHM